MNDAMIVEVILKLVRKELLTIINANDFKSGIELVFDNSKKMH